MNIGLQTKLHRTRQPIWSPSNYPSYKVNVDAARFMAQKAVGEGVIIRDHQGKFIAGLSKKFHAPLGIIEAEVKAFEAGIVFAKEVGIRDLVVEGDSLNVVGFRRGLIECCTSSKASFECSINCV